MARKRKRHANRRKSFPVNGLRIHILTHCKSCNGELTNSFMQVSETAELGVGKVGAHPDPSRTPVKKRKLSQRSGPSRASRSGLCGPTCHLHPWKLDIELNRHIADHVSRGERLQRDHAPNVLLARFEVAMVVGHVEDDGVL